MLLPGQSHEYDIGSEMKFDNVDTEFEFTLAGDTATKDKDYSLSPAGQLVFLERGVYQITMRNSAVQSENNGALKGEAIVTTEELIVAPAGLELLWSGSESGNAGFWTNDLSTHISNWLYYDNDIWYLDTDLVTFGADGFKTVNIESSGVNPGVMTIASGGYQFSGGAITAQAILMGAPNSDAEVLLESGFNLSDSLLVTGGKLVLESDEAHLAEEVAVIGGSLIVGKSAGSQAYLTAANGVMVAIDGRLGGHGQIYGDVKVGAGGTLSPGNSIGTTSINGDLTLLDGGFLDVEVDANKPGNRDSSDPGTSDRVLVSGLATLAGTLRVLTNEVGGALADYAAQGREWLILQATGGLNGEFEEAYSDMAFLIPQLFYDTLNSKVWLSFIQRTSVAPFASAYNELAVANALASLDQSGPVWKGLMNTHISNLLASLNSLSGEIYPTLKNALYHQDLSFIRTLTSRVSRIAAAASGQGGELLASLAPKVGVVRDNNFWATVEGSYLTLKGDGNAGKAELYGPEASLGYDRALPNGWIAGLAMKLADKKLKVDSRDSKVDVQTLAFALYGGKEIPLGPGDLRILLVGEYSHHDLESERTAIVGNNSQRLKGDFHASSYLAWLEAAYRLKVAGDNTVEPFVAVGYHHLKTNSFTERGGAAALRQRGEKWNHTLASLGLRSKIKVSDRVAINLEAGYRHSFGKKYPENLTAFASGGAPFRVRGVPISRDEFQVATGLSFAINDQVSLALDYQGDFGSQAQSHVGGLTLKVAW
ncbi:MAG: autotransporter domain-containing protein [Deltaproteobacteria bacterium]|nr:autotransporter domain-containing protein [Deltaproteobacteria bacterium]